MRATAGVPARKPDRRKQWKPKVRSGCATCKARKVKCDEAKPWCKRCVSSGRVCEGYTPIQCLMFNPDESSQERRAFKFFEERTSPELAGYFDAAFWRKLVLQAAQVYPALRHCLVAAASLHESLQLAYTSKTSEGRFSAEKARAFSLQQYNESIKCLLKANTSPLPVETILMACITFICYENFEGSYTNALTHVRHGLDILEECNHPRSAGPVHTRLNADIIDHLTKIFFRLQQHYSSWIGSKNIVSTAPTASTREELNEIQVPRHFADLHEAKFSLEECFGWEASVVSLLMINPDETTQTWFLERNCVVYAEYQAALGDLMDRHRHRQDIDFQRAAMTIKCHTMVGQLMAAILCAKNESIYDEYTNHFALMISEAKRVIDMAYRDQISTTRQISFSFDLGVIPVLYFAASRCRDPYLRRQAISLLQISNRREGLWDSATGARISERLLIIEEAGACKTKIKDFQPENSTIRSSRDIPESCRVRLLSTDAHPGNATMKLKFIRAPYARETCLAEEDVSVLPEAPVSTLIGGTESAGYWNSVYCNAFAANRMP